MKSYYDKLYGCGSVTRFLSEHPVSRETDRTVKGKLNYIYSSLLSEAWLLNREERKKIRPELRQYREILKFSDRRIHRLFYPLTCVFGLSGVGYILHLRWKLSQKKRSRG